MFKHVKLCLVYVMLMAILITSSGMNVLAEEVEISYGVEGEVFIPDVEGWTMPPSVKAETAIVMESVTALYQYIKGKDVIRDMGPWVKYMVMLVAEENCELDEEITFSKNTVKLVKEKGYPNIGAKKGEVMTVRDCLYAISMSSAADAMIELAVHVAGSVDEFVKMMNERAAELKCDSTFFAGITGLEEEKSYSTAYNTALIVRAMLKNNTFKSILKKTAYSIPATNKSEKRKLVCEETILYEDDPNYYEGCRTASVGYEENGGYNMFIAAKKNDITYIVVTFGNESSDDSYVDSKALLDYAHNNFVKEDFMIGSVLIPKMVSRDDIKVKGESDDDIVRQNYYLDTRLVGRGTQSIHPPEEETEDSLFPVLIPTGIPEEEDEEVWEDEDAIDMIETDEEVEYFTVYGLSLRQWNFVGKILIAVSIVIYLLIYVIVRNVKKNKLYIQQERERRKSMYEE